MSETENHTRSGSRARRIFVAAALALAALVALAIAGRIALGGAPGRNLALWALDGRPIGSLGALELEGLSGDVLRDLRIQRLAIADEAGEWLVVEDAHVVWRPGALLHRILHVERLEAGTVRVLRRPQVGDGRGDGGGRTWGVAINALALPRIELREGVLGGAAVLAAEASLEAERNGSIQAGLDVRRVDIVGDQLAADLSRGADGRMRLSASLAAAEQGPLARLLRLPSQNIGAAADLHGDLRAGVLRLDATLDGQPFVAATGAWRDGAGSATLHVRLAAAPELAALEERLGPAASLELDIDAGERNRLPATVTLVSGGLSLRAQGLVDVTTRTFPEGLSVSARTPRLDRLIGAAIADIASLGEAEVEGRVTLPPAASFDGDVAVRDVARAGWGAGRIFGHVAAARADGVATLNVDLAAEAARAPGAAAALLGKTPRLAGVARYEAQARALSIQDLVLTVAAGGATGEAQATMDGPVDARLDVALDAAAVPGLDAGSASLQLTARRGDAGEPLLIAATGAGEGLAATSPNLSRLLGSEASLDLAVSVGEDLAQITRAELAAANLQIMAEGAIGRAAGFDLAVDAAVEGPFVAGPVELAGQATAAAEIDGALEAPRLRLDLRAGGLAGGPVSLDQPRLKAEIADLFSAPAGRVELDAQSEQGPALLTANVAYRDGVLTARDISGDWRGYSVSGEAVRAPGGLPEGSLRLRGLEGRLAADVALAGGDGTPQLDLSVMLREQPLGETSTLAALTVTAEGPLDGLDIAASARGSTGVPFDLQARGRLVHSGTETRITLTPSGRLGDDEIAAPEPWTAAVAEGAVHVAAALQAAGGRLSARLDREDGRTALTADLEDAPLSLLGFVRPDPPLEGRASAQIDLAGAEILEGESRLVVTGARAPDYAVDGRLDLSLSLGHGAAGADVMLTADGESGARARVSGRAPLIVSAWPPVPRVDRDADVALTGEASGEIAPFWALAGLPTISLAGQIDARGSLRGNLREPVLEGSAELRGGRFEEARIGLVLADLQADARLTGSQLVIDSVSATDGGDGRLTGDGRILFGGEPGSETEVRLSLSRLRAIDAAESMALVSGDAELVRNAEGARLEGQLTIDRANITPPQGLGGARSVPTLEVEEINRPADLAPPPAPPRPAIDLDLRVSAGRQVYIRSNSLDTEWSFDVTIGGTTEDPTVTGTADLVRGDIRIASEPFELTRGRITFDGDVREAMIDFEAHQERPDLAVTVHVTGTPASPEVSLESTPPFPQDEILARMLFGAAKSELTALEAAQLANALSSLTGGMDLLSPLRETLGIDRLRVGSTEEGGAFVTGGRYLSRDVYLEVSSGAGLAEATLEWEIRPRLELASRFGIGTGSTVTLRWRKDY